MKRKLLIMIMINILLLQNSINKNRKFCCEISTDCDTKLISLYKTINSKKTKHLLVKNELKKL